VITRGMGDNIHLCPPLIITEAEIDELIRRIRLALDDTTAWLAVSQAAQQPAPASA